MDYSTFTEAALEARLAELRQDHSDLEAAIQALSNAPLPELIVIGRFKRKKLALIAEADAAMFAAKRRRKTG